MRTWDVLFIGGVAAVAAPVVLGGGPPQAQATPEVSGANAPITVETRLRHVTTLALPASAEIVEVVVGDAESWDVSSSAHLAFVRPLEAGAESNLVLLTASGSLFPVVIVEREDAPAAAVVHLGGEPTPGGGGDVLTTADSVETAAARAAAAWESAARAEARAVERIAAARLEAQATLDVIRERYPRALHFDYRWPAGSSPSEWPWLVEGMWHDGERTYVRTRATSPVLYELVDGEPEAVEVTRVLDGVLHVVPRVLGAGELEVRDERLRWSVATRLVGP